MKITLTRIKYADHSTLGVLDLGKEKLYTLERPWINNQPNISCIPDGFYTFKPHSGTRFKNVWEVENVPNRSYILFHAGNTAKDTEGCVLVGEGLHHDEKGAYIINSEKALEAMRSILGSNGGIIEVKSI